MKNRKMQCRSQQMGARGISMDMKTSWAAQESAHDSTFPNLETMARFQQKQLQEKEQKLLQLYDQQQQRAYQVVQRGSAGSNSSNHGSTRPSTTTTTTTATHTTSTSQGGKVRQMFDERRQTTVKGIDRSYPLEPLENKLRKQTNGVTTQRNGNVTVNRQSVKRVSRADVNSNVNGGKPVVSYHEEIVRDSFGLPVRRHEINEDEYGVENRIATFANGHYRHEIDNEQEEALDQDLIERNRMMAKIHLMGFDETLKHRVRNDLESEEFPEYLMADVSDKLSKRNVTKKLSQAEERLERFKNANAKRSNVPKQSTSTSSVIRKRSEQAKSNSRLRNENAGTSPISARSSWASERSQRILENVKSPLPFRIRVADEMSARRRKNSNIEMLSQRTSPRSFSTREATKTETTSRFYPRNEFKSLTSDGKIFVRCSASPQFFCRESERSGTTMSIDRKSDSSGSALFHWETKRNRRPRFFFNESEQSRRTIPSETKSSLWDDTGVSSRQSTNSQYFHYEPKRSETAMNTDRETIGSKSSECSKGTLTKRDMSTDSERKKIQTSTTLNRRSSQSPLYEEKILKRRSTSPQFFCKESERSATTMSIDRATSDSRSPSYDREIITKRSASPFFLNESEQFRKTNKFKPIWGDREISRQITSPQYREFKRSETATSTDRKTVGSKLSEWNKRTLTKQDMSTDSERKKVQTSTTLGRRFSQSPLYEEKILKRRSPQFFCRESERSATTMSIDRATSESRSPSYDREVVTKERSPFFFSESEKSLIWGDRGISRQNPQYHESKRSETATSIDRETVGSKTSEWSKEILTKRGMTDFERKKVQTSTTLNRRSSQSPLYEEKILKRRSTSPQFFCRESERSATTMSSDRATSESRSPSYDREIVTKGRSPFSLSESEQSHRTSESKSPIWNDRGISSRQSVSPQYRESKRSEIVMSTDRKTIASKSSEKWSKQSKRSDTTTSIDRKVSKPISSSYDRKILKRSATPRLLNGKTEQRSATTTTSINRKYNGFKSRIIPKRSTSPQFFCKESEKSATTMLIKPRSRSVDSIKSVLKQRNYKSDTSYKRSVQSPIDKKISFTNRFTSSPSVNKYEVKRASTKNKVSNNIIEARRSSKISEISTTSASSIVNLKYGLEFDNIFQSTGLVRKFMKAQDGKQHANRQSISKCNVTNVDARISRNNRSKNQRKTSPLLQTTRSPSIESRKRTTPEFSRKSITPTEVDMDIQEITMTDHRIERDKLQKASSPISKRQFDRTYTKSPSSRMKFKTSITYPVRKTHRQRESILESDIFKRGISEKRSSIDHQSNRESEESVISLSRFRPVNESSCIITRDSEDESRMSSQTPKQFARNQAKCLITQSTKYENRQRETMQKPIKLSTSKKTIPPMRKCSKLHDIKSRVLPRVSLRKTTEISHDAYPLKIFLSRNIVSKPDQSFTSKFSTSTTKDRKHDSTLVAKKLAESFNKMSVKRKTEESKDTVKEFSKVLCRDKYEKDLKRMNSVESALRRFDSIGAEFERSSPTDFRASPEISLQTIDVQTKTSIKDSIASEGITVPSREVTDHMILRSTLKSPVKDLKAKNATYKNDLRTLQKETCSSKRLTRIESATENNQKSTKIRSPMCKRRLFESDSEKEIQEERSKSSCVKARKDENCPFISFRFHKDEAVSNVRSFKDLSRDVTRDTMGSEETSFSVKPLRSIEDIRKSIDNEQNKLIAVEKSRSAIANRCSVSREGVDAKRPSPATSAAKNIFLGTDPARLIKIKSCVSRITKSPSPDPGTIKQRETNARTTRGSAPSSPSKSPDVAPRRTATESRNQEAKTSRKSTVAKDADSSGSKVTATGAIDATDGVVLENGLPNESTTRKSDSYMIDFDDRPSKEDDAMPLKKSSMKKSSNDKQQTASSALGRPASSNSSVTLIQDSSAKGRMAESERGKGTGKGGSKNRGKGIEKPSSSSGKLANVSSFNEDATTDMKGLVKCKTCGRSFAQNRIDRHEEICTKTTTKKRKQFDPVMSRVKGTELEPFVKKSLVKGRETKTKKPETKPDWRRKHEEFINAIRYARETQARLAAGGNLSDLPPPPPSDTSDYIQCEHCGRKFNRSAAERHIPICKRMHDKKQAPKARR